MKMLIQIVVVALIAGGLSAAGSHFLNPWLNPWLEKFSPSVAATDPSADATHTDDPSAPTDGSAEGAAPETEATALAVEVISPPAATAFEPLDLEPPVAIRPPFSPESDEAGILINELRARAASASNQERRLSERQEALELIFDDFRVEQINSAKIRQRIFDAMNQS